MKRLYSMMLSAAVAVAASAAIPSVKAPAQLSGNAATEVISPLTGGLNFRAEKPAGKIADAMAHKTNRPQVNHVEGGKLQRVAKAPRKAEGNGSKFDGTYTLTAGEWYLNSQSKSSVPVQVEMTVEDGVATISNSEYLFTDVLALLDEETGEMSFVNFYVGQNSSHAISFMPFVYESGINFSTYSIQWDEATQSFDIPSDHGISWVAWDLADIDDAKAFNTATMLGYYDIFDVEGLVKNETGGEEPEDPETWTSLGMGEWYEGLLTIFSDIDDGQHWSVEIEESDKTPGVYRMKPYAVEGNPISVILGGRLDTTTEVVVNATNPDKVYTVGRFAPFNLRIFSGINPENNFNGNAYGTMTDKVISFPSRSFAYSSNGTSWSYVSKEGFKIALPGAVVKDYTFHATTPAICPDGENTVVNLDLGEDIAAVKVMVLKGKYDATYGDNANFIAGNGEDVELGPTYTVATPEEPGIYSIMFVALNADGEIVGATTTNQIFDFENDEDWAVLTSAKAVYTEGFLSSFFSDVDPEEFEVVLEQNVNTPGRFRFEAPYANHSMNFPVAQHSHKHYIYVNATNPDKVYVELSPLGVSVNGFGSAYGFSYPGLYADTETFETLPGSYFGTFADGKISAPALASFNNAPYIGNSTATFELTITANVEHIEMGAIVGEVGEYVKVRPEVLPADALIVKPEITWSSSNPEVAAVDEDGKVWFNAAGSAVVTAQCQGFEFSVPFEVEAVLARALNVFPVEAVGGKGHSFCLLALHEPDNTTDKSVVWHSEDPEIASVDETGHVELLSSGTTKIIATSGEHTAACAVTVDDTDGLTELASTGVVIDVVEDGIVVRNVEEGESIAVYTIDGKVINGAVAQAGETKLTLTTGIYIVKVSPNTVAKVLVK